MDPDPMRLLREDGAHAIRGIPKRALAGKRVLVTGASGLIGTHILAGLVDVQRRFGVEIFALVHDCVPAHLEELARDADVRFLRGDLCDRDVALSLPESDIIVHAATYGQPGMFTAQPVTTLRLNTEGTFALFDKLRPHGQFLFLSTSELYSGLADPPFTEDQIGTTNTGHPRSCYIEGKRAGEAICHAYRARGVDAKAVRLALAYGPGTRTRDRRVLNAFIEKALVGGEIRLLDQGLARRTYCYVRDAVEMMWHILLQGRHPIYNVGGVSGTTIGDLASRIGKAMNVPVHLPASGASSVAGAPDDVSLDLGRYENEFGRVEFLGLDEGLERTIGWQRDFVYAPQANRRMLSACPV